MDAVAALRAARGLIAAGLRRAGAVARQPASPRGAREQPPAVARPRPKPRAR